MNDADVRNLIGAQVQMVVKHLIQIQAITVGDKFVFTSCKMMGAMGPYEEMLQLF